jgi:hypothetical protein
MAKATCVIYWLHDSRCVCPWRHGYIGISTWLQHRLAAHRRGQGTSARVPANFSYQILFKGTAAECRALEYKLRPHFDIGWNHNPGGGKTDSERIRASMLGRRITWGDKIAKTLTGHVRTLESRAKQSSNVKGIPKSPEWRSKASAAAKARYSKPGEKERTAATVRKALKDINRLQRHYRKHGQLDFDL